MEWNTVTMSIIGSLVFIVVVLFNFFIAMAMPHEDKNKRRTKRE
ncbi:hypothetical protein [Effusibacillus lacus]|nr:hypothetical protein [Effusibacillus lacus]